MSTNPYSPPRAIEPRPRTSELGPAVRRMVWQVTWMAGAAMFVSILGFVYISTTSAWRRHSGDLDGIVLICLAVNAVVIGYVWLLRSAKPNGRILATLLIANGVLLLELMALIASIIGVLTVK